MNRNLSIVFIFMILLSAAVVLGCTGEEGAEKNTANAAGTFKYVTAEIGLRLRKAPSTESPALGLIPFKTKVEVLEINSEKVKIGDTEGQWNRVKWGEITGWAFDGFLRIEPFEEETQEKK